MVKGGYSPDYGTILSSPRFIVPRILSNIHFYLNITGEAVFSSLVYSRSPLWLKDLLSLIAAVTVLFGIRDIIKEKRHVSVFFILFYIMGVIIWPHTEDGRYLLPVLPLLLYCFYHILFKIFSKRKTTKIVLFTFLVIIFSLHMAGFLFFKRATRDNVPKVNDLFCLNEWMRDNSLEPGVVVSRKPRITFYFSGHKSICFPFTNDIEKIRAEITRHNARYITVDGLFRETYYYLIPFVIKNKNVLEPVKTIGTATLFKIRQGGIIQD